MLRFIRNLIFYPLGILILILGISFCVDSIIGGLLLMVVGLLTLPIVNKKIVEHTNEKLKGWKYVAVTLIAFFIGVGTLPSDTSTTLPSDTSTDVANVNGTELANRNNATITEAQQREESIKKDYVKKIDTNFKDKKYSNLVEMYVDLTDEGKEYFVEKLEEHILENFNDFTKENEKIIEDVENLLINFESLKVNSELITLIQSLLQDLKMYESEKSELKSVTSIIPSGSECEILNVYVTQRVRNSSFIGEEYTDNYVAYPYTYLFNKPYPDYDADAVILYSKQPLNEGVGTFYCTRSGTYQTQNSKGFEVNNLKYDVYSTAEWDKYYEKNAIDAQISELDECIDAIYENFSKLSGNNAEVAKNILKESLLSRGGNWHDENHNITMWISSYIPGNYEVYIYQQLTELENPNEVKLMWTIENAHYDGEIGALVYSKSLCEKEELAPYYPGHPREYTIETLYTDGNGKIFIKDGVVYWEDTKEKDSVEYKFTFKEYDTSLEDDYSYEDYYYNEYGSYEWETQ